MRPNQFPRLRPPAVQPTIPPILPTPRSPSRPSWPGSPPAIRPPCSASPNTTAIGSPASSAASSRRCGIDTCRRRRPPRAGARRLPGAARGRPSLASWRRPALVVGRGAHPGAGQRLGRHPRRPDRRPLVPAEVDDGAAAPARPRTSIAETFARLVEEDPLVELVAEAARAARARRPTSLVCLLDYRIQQDQGDPSPAHTLAERYGVTPDRSVSGSAAGRRRLRGSSRRSPLRRPGRVRAGRMIAADEAGRAAAGGATPACGRRLQPIGWPTGSPMPSRWPARHPGSPPPCSRPAGAPASTGPVRRHVGVPPSTSWSGRSRPALPRSAPGFLAAHGAPLTRADRPAGRPAAEPGQVKMICPPAASS